MLSLKSSLRSRPNNPFALSWCKQGALSSTTKNPQSLSTLINFFMFTMNIRPFQRGDVCLCVSKSFKTANNQSLQCYTHCNFLLWITAHWELNNWSEPAVLQAFGLYRKIVPLGNSLTYSDGHAIAQGCVLGPLRHIKLALACFINSNGMVLRR